MSSWSHFASAAQWWLETSLRTWCGRLWSWKQRWANTIPTSSAPDLEVNENPSRKIPIIGDLWASRAATNIHGPSFNEASCANAFSDGLRTQAQSCPFCGTRLATILAQGILIKASRATLTGRSSKVLKTTSADSAVNRTSNSKPLWNRIK